MYHSQLVEDKVSFLDLAVIVLVSFLDNLVNDLVCHIISKTLEKCDQLILGQNFILVGIHLFEGFLQFIGLIWGKLSGQ